MKYYTALSKKKVELQPIDNLTEKVTLRLKSDKKRELFNIASENNITVSELIRQVLNQIKPNE